MTLPPLPSGATIETYPDESTWLAGRSLVEHQLGGSDIAAIMARSPDTWGRGPWTLWARSQGLETHGFNAAAREDLERGHRWELFILRDEYARRKGVTLALEGRRAVVRHPDHPWATVSPDDFGTIDGQSFYVEAKTARHGEHEYGPDGTVIETWDGEAASLIPVHYALQVLWGLEITGLPWVDLVAAIPRGRDWPEVRVVRLMAQPQLQAELFAAVAERRERWMVRGEQPPVDATDDCGYALTQLFPKPPTKSWKTADAPAWEAVERRARLSAQIKALQAEYRKAGNEIQALIGEDYGIRLPGGDCGAMAVRMSGREAVNLGAIRKGHPDLLAQLTEQGLINTSAPSVQIRLFGFDGDE